MLSSTRQLCRPERVILINTRLEGLKGEELKKAYKKIAGRLSSSEVSYVECNYPELRP